MEKTVDNVIILGAGASYNAGVPLMSNFVDKMWDYAIRGKANGVPLSKNDQRIFKEAIGVRDKLDNFHGRASFNDRNIEDILSILTFDSIMPKKNRRLINIINRAISRTIELSCTVKHSGILNEIEDVKQNQIYIRFWKSLFSFNEDILPSIISFNYDLVLERSLLNYLINTHAFNNNISSRKSGITIKYFYNLLDELSYKFIPKIYRGPKYSDSPGIKLEFINKILSNSVNIEILKLHGSLNFPLNRINKKNILPYNITKSLLEPYILPPIFNKNFSKDGENIWSNALSRLRTVKNIIIIGYSLPKTDIYMQYFLKSALGPNKDLNKIFIFDPILNYADKTTEDMKSRYLDCFAPQMKDRIIFNPSHYKMTRQRKGSFSYLVDILDNEPKNILF